MATTRSIRLAFRTRRQYGSTRPSAVQPDLALDVGSNYGVPQ
jgi:hypothetical protein